VLVRNTPPADLAMAPVTVTEGDTMTLSGTFSDSDKLDTHTVGIVWGDSPVETTVSLGPGTHGFSATHVYKTRGSYKPAVTVTDLPANESVTGSTDVTVLVRTKTTGELLGDLATLVHSWNVDAMSAKVDAARDTLDSSTDSACSSLKTLSNMVSAQSGKKIPMDHVDAFWSLLTKVDAAVPCAETKAAQSYYSSRQN
jgi:PKD domain-containing protein